MKPWIFLPIFIFSKVTNIYGSFSIDPVPSVRPGDTIVLKCRKSDELHEAVYWREDNLKLSTCLKEKRNCYPDRSPIRPHITFTAMVTERIFYMIIENSTKSDFKVYICGDLSNEATADLNSEVTEATSSNPQQGMRNGNAKPNELDGNVNCACKDGSVKSECCSDCTQSSSDTPVCQKRIEEEGSQAVSMMGLFVSSIVMNVILICIVVMVKIRMNQQTRKHNDQRQPKADDDGQNEDTKKLNV